MISPLIRWLKTTNPWHYLWITVLLAELFTALCNVVNGYIWYGAFAQDLLLIGAVDALVVSLLVAPVLIYFIKSTARLAAANEQLEKEMLGREKTHEQMRLLSARLEAVREEERTTIAREVHDELGQILTALKLNTQWLEKRLPSGEREILDKIAAMSRLIDETIQSVRKICAQLRPVVLDDLGLVPAIKGLVDEFRKSTEITCELICDLEDDELDRDCSTAVYRIVQELLTNVARHAAASRVGVVLTLQEDEVYVEVSDNGVGLPPVEMAKYTSAGLIGIQERAYSLGGKVSFFGRPGKGTTVTVSIPL